MGNVRRIECKRLFGKKRKNILERATTPRRLFRTKSGTATRNNAVWRDTALKRIAVHFEELLVHPGSKNNFRIEKSDDEQLQIERSKSGSSN